MTKEKHYFFTITQGRTGTTYLAALLKSNLPPDSEAHHEILGYDKFGIDTPNLSTFTIFNSQGNVGEVKKFWERKLKKISNTPHPIYIETSHLLAKAGLCENLHLLPKKDTIHIVVLKRDIIKTLESYHKTFSFLNIGNMWMWYLDPDYPKKIVNPLAFARLGVYGVRLWYIYEINARIEYYKIKLQKQKNVLFHEVDIDDLNDKKKIKEFRKNLGFGNYEKEISIPPKLNTTKDMKMKIGDRELEEIKKVIDGSVIKPKKLARDYIGKGGSWD